MPCIRCMIYPQPCMVLTHTATTHRNTCCNAQCNKTLQQHVTHKDLRCVGTEMIRRTTQRHTATHAAPHTATHIATHTATHMHDKRSTRHRNTHASHKDLQRVDTVKIGLTHQQDSQAPKICERFRAYLCPTQAVLLARSRPVLLLLLLRFQRPSPPCPSDPPMLNPLSSSITSPPPAFRRHQKRRCRMLPRVRRNWQVLVVCRVSASC